MFDGKNSTYEIRLNAINAYLKNYSVADISKTYNTHRATIYRWIEKYNNGQSIDNLKRKPVSGRPNKLNESHLDSITDLILQPATNFDFETDFWTCRRIEQIISEKVGINLSRQTIWRKLRSLGLTYQKPERRYKEADEELRQHWLTKELPKILEIAKKYKAILYFQDESNISLTAVLGKTWAPKGKTPIQKVTGGRSSVAAMSAISKSGDLIFTIHEKRIASEEVIHFLDQMLKHHSRRHLVVIMDGARPHTSKMTRCYIEKQKRLHVFYLPAYSPDFNPDEKVWNYLKIML
jgi:transposase